MKWYIEKQAVLWLFLKIKWTLCNNFHSIDYLSPICPIEYKIFKRLLQNCGNESRSHGQLWFCSFICWSIFTFHRNFTLQISWNWNIWKSFAILDDLLPKWPRLMDTKTPIPAWNIYLNSFLNDKILNFNNRKDPVIKPHP